jgi:hypothetical protein
VIDVDAWLAAWNSQEAGPIIAISDPAIEVHAVTLGIDGRHYVGPDGLRQWMRDIRDRFHARSRTEAIEPLSDDAVLMRGRLFMRSELGDDEDEQPFALVVHLENDKARWVGTFFSPSDAKAAWQSGVTGPQPG